ncbi:hypothetical protein [Desulfobotulus sp.]|jgi:hypothetical protein|uniref:hypothetical protein n=1 Tax=Desulfobotulus sp. TaxID=1940337 RepID=UPI002A35D56C|nr:hypothetical protein [Desulfobotulus sp.]MDY0162231.1 hypothetical protein [Desulfobotulus sp.]
MKSFFHPCRREGISWFLLFVLLVSGFAVQRVGAQVQLGLEIPEGAPVIRLQSVFQDPSIYDGKVLVMKGFVASQCPALCDFTFRDGVHTATIFSQGFKFPKLQRGKAITVYAQVITGKERVVFSALGLKME